MADRIVLNTISYHGHGAIENIVPEMTARGYKVSPEWWEPNYRGKTCPAYPELKEEALNTPIYPEHQDTYLQECLDNLAEKGIQLD